MDSQMGQVYFSCSQGWGLNCDLRRQGWQLVLWSSFGRRLSIHWGFCLFDSDCWDLNLKCPGQGHILNTWPQQVALFWRHGGWNLWEMGLSGRKEATGGVLQMLCLVPGPFFLCLSSEQPLPHGSATLPHRGTTIDRTKTVNWHP